VGAPSGGFESLQENLLGRKEKKIAGTGEGELARAQNWQMRGKFARKMVSCLRGGSESARRQTKRTPRILKKEGTGSKQGPLWPFRNLDARVAKKNTRAGEKGNSRSQHGRQNRDGKTGPGEPYSRWQNNGSGVAGFKKSGGRRVMGHSKRKQEECKGAVGGPEKETRQLKGGTRRRESKRLPTNR